MRGPSLVATRAIQTSAARRRKSMPASTSPRYPALGLEDRADCVPVTPLHTANAIHFDAYGAARLQIADGVFSYQRTTEQIAAEAALHGFYVIRTTCDQNTLTSQATVRGYKQLKAAERALRTINDTVEIRPIHHHLEDRVRAHAFLCMLAHYLSFELRARLTRLLFDDETPRAPADPVAPAQRSPNANAKAGSAHTEHGYPAHTLPDSARRPRHPLPRRTTDRPHRAHFTGLTTPHRPAGHRPPGAWHQTQHVGQNQPAPPGQHPAANTIQCRWAKNFRLDPALSCQGLIDRHRQTVDADRR